MTHTTASGAVIECIQGDITNQPDMDAIVNAANARLMPGGGVAGAIHRAAGPGLAEECQPLAPLQPGEAVVTRGHHLPNPWVIHCLGPVYGQDEPAEDLLADCYQKALDQAEEKRLQSVAFPALSTGAFGYPKEAAAQVAMQSVLAALEQLQSVKAVRFVLFSEQDRALHQRVLTELVDDA